MDYKSLFSAVLFSALLPVCVYGQEVSHDTLSVKNIKPSWQQVILPASLIGTGAVALVPGFVRNGSRHVTNKVIDMRGNNRRVEFEDYVQYLPVASSLMLGCTGVDARHNFRDRALIVATSYAVLAILTNVPKACINEKRPGFSSHNSFPSGHTATAFMGAELVRMEYGGWYGAGAYVVAAGVGFMRMYNSRHWLHDVVAGAGVGILSARIGEWSCLLWHEFLWKDKKKNCDVVLTPVIGSAHGGYYGFAMGCCF